MIIAQDDAAFLGVREPSGRVHAISLARGPGGRRRFEARLGNKKDKPDLEGCAGLPGDRVLAVGSGSTPARERWVIVEPDLRPRTFDASALYAALRAEARFAGSELNVEGVAIDSQARLRLFQRGNGAGDAVNATVDLDLEETLAWIEGRRSSPPALLDLRRYELGHEDGVPYGFTDACALGGATVFVAGAEASPNTYDDGEIRGARAGVIDERGARFTPLLDRDGARAIVKAEGILPWREAGDRAWVVIDGDDPDRPAELCEVALEGPWLP